MRCDRDFAACETGVLSGIKRLRQHENRKNYEKKENKREFRNEKEDGTAPKNSKSF